MPLGEGVRWEYYSGGDRRIKGPGSELGEGRGRPLRGSNSRFPNERSRAGRSFGRKDCSWMERKTRGVLKGLRSATFEPCPPVDVCLHSYCPLHFLYASQSLERTSCPDPLRRRHETWGTQALDGITRVGVGLGGASGAPPGTVPRPRPVGSPRFARQGHLRVCALVRVCV